MVSLFEEARFSSEADSLNFQALRRPGGYAAVPSDDADGGISPQTSSQALLSRDDRLHGGTLVIHPDGHSYTYSYGPKGLTGLLHNYYALGCAVFVSIGGLLFGYDQGVIANVLVMKDFTQRWPIGAWEKGVMSVFRPWLPRFRR